MADYLDYLTQYARPDTVTANTPPITPVIPNPADVQAVDQAGNNPDANLGLNIAINRGNTRATDNQVVSDFQRMPYFNFVDKYGISNAIKMGDIVAGRQQLDRIDRDDRELGDHLDDATKNVVTGLVGGLGDASTAIAGAVNRQAGRFAANKTQDFRNWMYENQTDDAQRNRFLSGFKAQLDEEDNTKQYEKDRKDKSAFVAGLSYLGRGVVNGAARFIEDPRTLESGLGEGVGSLLAAGPAAKGIGIIGKLAGVGKAVSEANVVASIAAMEGGSAYSGALQEVMGMSHDDLLLNSPSYKDLVSSGIDPEKAKETVASKAAETALAIQAPLAAASGKIVAGFEAHPFGSKGFKDMVKNILHETVEEGAQSFTGQGSQNIGIQQNADINKNILEGIGDQVSQGAILGGLTAGAVQAPVGPKLALQKAVTALKDRAASIQTANEEGSGVSDQDLKEAAKTASENLAPVADTVDSLKDAIPENIRTNIDADSLKNRIENAITIKDEDIRSLGKDTLSYFKENNIDVPQDRINFLQATAKAVLDPASNPKAKQSAGLFLLNEIEKQSKLFGEAIEEVKSSLNQDSDEYKAISNYQNLLKQIENHPLMRNALDEVRNNVKVDLPDTQPVNQQDVTDVMRAAEAKPSAISPQTVNTILKQADEGNITLSPEQRKVLANTADIIQIAQKGDNDIKLANQEAGYEVPLTEASNEVNEQILTKGRQQDWGLSLDQHIGRINQALSSNNIPAASTALRNFGNFAASQRNKANAAIRSLREGGKQTFQRLGSYGRVNPVPGEWIVHPNNPSSLAQARQIIIEANTLIDAVNKLTDQNPELNVPKLLTKLDLIPELFGNKENNSNENQFELPLEQAPKEVKKPIEPEKVINTSSTQKRFPSLVQNNKVVDKAVEPFNYFHRTFETSKIGKLLLRDTPITDFIDALDKGVTAREFIGKNPEFTVSGEQIGNLQDYLDKGYKTLYKTLNEQLNAALNEVYNKETNTTLLDRLNDGYDVPAIARGHALTIVEKSGNSYKYNSALIQTAILAALNWYSASENRSGNSNLEKQDIADITGLNVADITNSKLAEFNSGIGLTQAVRSLAAEISAFWGLKENRDAPTNMTKGIPEAIAKELLEAMLSNKFMESTLISIPNSKEKYIQYYFNKNPNNADILNRIKDMGVARRLIEMAAIAPNEREDATYDAPPKEVARTQLRNPNVKNTNDQIKVLKKAQNLKHNFYKNSFDMLTKIGPNGWIKLMGSKVIDDKTPFNEENLRSVQGRNLTIEQAFNGINEQVDELNAYAKKLNKDPEQVNKYYKFNYTRVGRLLMFGANNPVADKIARHVFLPTRATLDLSDDTSDHSIAFWMAIAQGLGVKNQNFSREENARQGRELITNPQYDPLVQDLQQWLKDGKEGDLTQWVEKAVRNVPEGLSEHGVMSLLSAAEYYNARDNGTLENFVTHNYFEADGVSNGAANALMNMTTNISAKWIDTVRKVGAFIGRKDYSMVNNASISDLYKSAAEINSELQNDFAQSLPDDVRPVYDAMFRLIHVMNMNISFNGEEVEIARKALKNPSTITVYGSGVDGIAGNITNEFLDNFYEAISDHLQTKNDIPFGDDLQLDGRNYSAKNFWTDMNTILTNRITKTEEGFDVFSEKKPVKIPSNDQLIKLSIDPSEFKILRDNMRTLFVDNMDRAIKQAVMEHVGETVDVIQKASNAQSIVMYYKFRKEILKEMADRKINPDKYPNYRSGDFLSEKEFQDIYARLMPYAAKIDTGFQSFLLGSGERSDLMKSDTITFEGKDYKINLPSTFSLSLAGQLKTDSYTHAPKIAGVSVVPSFNIGTGDGRMIDIFLQNLKGFDVLPVYDGINIPIDKVFEGSNLANSAVMQTWNENPIQHVVESFKSFLRNDPLNDMFDKNDPFNVETNELAYELTKNELGIRKPKETWSKDAISASFNNRFNDLENRSSLIDSRIQAMKDMPMAVDQMAGGQSPYTQEGNIPLPTDPTSAQIATALNEHFIKIAAKKNSNQKEVIENPRKDFVAAFRSLARPDVDTGVLVADVGTLNGIRQRVLNKLNNNSKEMFTAALASLTDSDLKVVFGTPDMVDRYEQNNYPDTYDANVDSYFGKLDVLNNVIYLTNPSAETLVHELIHAATIFKMQGYYSDKSLVSKTDGDAIARLEGLMNEWLSKNYENEGPVVGEAHRLAISSITNFLNQGKTAEALNEFIAWSLTNQNIQMVQKKIQILNPTFKLLNDALKVLKTLIFGKNNNVGDDIFSNVKFNAKLLMSTPTPVELFMRDFNDIILYQSPEFGTDNRLSDIRQKFANNIYSIVREGKSQLNKIGENPKRTEVVKVLKQYADIANKFAAVFHMNMQQFSTMKLIGATLTVSNNLNSGSLTRLYEIYDHVINTLTYEDFLYNDGRDEQIDVAQAQAKYNALTGVDVTRVDAKGRSTQLPSFLALANVDPQLRDILRKMKFPKNILDDSWSADALFDRASQAVTSGLANYAAGIGKTDPDLNTAIDLLTQSLIENVGDQRSFIEQRIENGADRVDNLFKSYIEKSVDKAQSFAKTVEHPIGKKAAKFLNRISNLLTEEGTKQLNRQQISFVNQPEINNDIREAVSEIIGRTKENAPVFDMITKTRTLVDQTRQKYREQMPALLRGLFKQKLDARSWSDLHRGLGNTDAAVLYTNYGKTRALQLLSLGSERAAEIRNLKAKLTPQIIAKAEQLADYMLTDNAGKQIQKNAHAIAVINKALDSEQDIDNLVTLLAYNKLDEKTRENIENIIENQNEGFTGVYHSLIATRNDELTKAQTEIAKMNLRKGYLSGINQDGVHLVIDDRTNHSDYILKGYVDLGDYVGSSADTGRTKKGYYFAPVSGRAKFNQGVIQTVQQSVFGVHPETGYMVGQINAGRITEPRAVDAITRRINGQLATDEPLIPVYANNGEIIAYERAADPKKLVHLDPTYDLASALGIWRGRQSEEQFSKVINESLVDNVYGIWKEGLLEKQDREFVDVSRSTDPIIKDAWNVIPRETKQYIKEVFGNAGFPVRRSDLLDIIGSRSASIGDLWTGNSRWSPTTQKELKDIFIGLMGNNAYKTLVNFENNWQHLVTDAKVMIVVKSMIVPAANFVASMYQLQMHGVPMRHIIDGYKRKIYELNTYLKTDAQKRKLENELQIAEGANNSIAIRKLKSRIQAIDDSYRNFSIFPLLNQGEYGAITEGGSKEDLMISRGAYAELIDSIIKKIPEGPRDIVRYGLVTRDTSLFRALSRATQYGDFIAKSVLFDDLIRRKNMSQTEALAYVSEEFVNFNRFAGRKRSYLESMGMLWFYNFKIRSVKVSQRMLQQHPVRALFFSALNPRIPFLGSIGNPITDNFLSMMMNGKLGASLGPNQLFRAPHLNPVYNLLN